MPSEVNKVMMSRNDQISVNGDQGIAHLNTLNFSAIVSGDPSETDLLLKSCIEDGFFYLDLLNDDTRRILEDVDGIYALMKTYFRQPLEVKMKDFRGGGQWG